ncbi:MAG: hypothetical protein F6J87_17500 [Spirulina sp. SIO3F2]|nr:hypothetical protein [Spirulina sp. SIO3F2]
MSYYLGNAGVPFFTSNVGYSIFLLVPIVLIEAYGIWKLLNIHWGRSLLITIYANGVSTAVGAVVFVLLGGLISTVLGAGLVNPIHIILYLIEFLLTLIPMFYLSVWLEGWLVRPFLRHLAKPKVRQAIFTIHLYSYGLLAFQAIGKLVIALVEAVLRRDPNWWVLYLR